MNLFTKAGPVERVKIVAPKQENATNTFGFVAFKTKMAAQTAITMFDNTKCGNSYLKVKMNEAATAKPPLPQSNAFGADYKPRQASRDADGEGLKLNANLDLSRPYAKQLFERIKKLSSKLPDDESSESESHQAKSSIDLNNNNSNHGNINGNIRGANEPMQKLKLADKLFKGTSLAESKHKTRILRF